MPEMKTVVAGQHGSVPRGDNSRRYIGDEPVEVDLQGPHGAYYARRLMFGDLVEYVAPPPSPKLEPRAVAEGEMLRSAAPPAGVKADPLPMTTEVK